MGCRLPRPSVANNSPPSVVVPVHSLAGCLYSLIPTDSLSARESFSPVRLSATTKKKGWRKKTTNEQPTRKRRETLRLKKNEGTSKGVNFISCIIVIVVTVAINDLQQQHWQPATDKNKEKIADEMAAENDIIAMRYAYLSSLSQRITAQRFLSLSLSLSLSPSPPRHTHTHTH